MIPLVLTFVGDDRPGLVNAVSEKIAACGGTWLESRSARLAGKFAGHPARRRSRRRGRPSSDRACACSSRRAFALTSIERGARRGANAGAAIKLDIVGNERPGIVRDVTQALTGLGVNIEEFASSLEAPPFTGVEMFRASGATARARPAFRSRICARRWSGSRAKSWSI